MVTTFICDRMWGRYTCNRFIHQFPQFRGRELTFSSHKSVELDPVVYAWLKVNQYI